MEPELRVFHLHADPGSLRTHSLPSILEQFAPLPQSAGDTPEAVSGSMFLLAAEQGRNSL
ncbi:MAG: hypothetical protein KME18_26725 [Phormidium tanganyikae FI6-MK23]|jgi:hypothetical protein|nr:hypothetical protein [Phormidium tanganyikae FI6-MK23]